MFQSFIMKKTSTFFDETIHIMFKCAFHLHHCQNKVVPFMKPSLLTNVKNGVRFYNYICWLINDIQKHYFSYQVNNHHINNENLILSSYVKTDF